MKNISDFTKNPPPREKPRVLQMRSPRDEVIQLFLGHGIQVRDRTTKTLVDATAEDIAILLKDVPTGDIYPFLKQCSNARTFSKWFWWGIKNGPIKKKQQPSP